MATRTRRIKDNSPRFNDTKNYAIGTLQNGAGTEEVPEKFSPSPKALHYSGGHFTSLGIYTCNDFLSTEPFNTYFKQNSSVYFYEVEHTEDGQTLYKNIHIGSPLVRVQPQVQQGLSDSKAGVVPSITNIIPNANQTEQEKLLYKTQTEQIAYFQKCLQDERKQFNDERIVYTNKINEQQEKILELNLRINTLEAENRALQIRYEELNKYSDKLSKLVESEKEEVEEPQGLADRTVGMLDGMLGDGASMQIVAGLATGLGNGLGKLIDLGVDYARQKGIGKSATEQAQVQQQMPPQVQPQIPAQPVMMPEEQMQQLQQQLQMQQFQQSLN